MRYRFIAALAAFAALLAPLAKADDAPKDVKGLYLMSDYPAVTVRPGETSTDQSASAQLRLAARAARSVRLRRAAGLDGNADGRRPAGRGGDAGNQCQRLARTAARRAEECSRRHADAHGQRRQGDATKAELPVAVTLAKDLPAKLTLTPQLPELRGTSKSSFEYQLTIKNDSGKKLTGQPRRPGAAEFRRHVHRAVRQPGAQRHPGRCRPDQGREAEGAPAEHGRRPEATRSSARVGAEDATRDGRARHRHHRPAEARHQRPRRPGVSARAIGRQGDARCRS